MPLFHQRMIELFFKMHSYFLHDPFRAMGGIIILPTLAKKMCALLANVN